MCEGRIFANVHQGKTCLQVPLRFQPHGAASGTPLEVKATPGCVGTAACGVGTISFSTFLILEYHYCVSTISYVFSRKISLTCHTYNVSKYARRAAAGEISWEVAMEKSPPITTVSLILATMRVKLFRVL